ncbi:MAG: fibronectin type III domain-containing protein, partial [Bacteroidales bacterium]|nr:fibronectin type III domain-containing protein [Bacteroidales bacterium]
MKKIDTLKTLTRTMQSFVAMMLVTLMAVGSVVAQTTYSHTITVKTWSALGEQSLNGVNWTATGTATDGGYFGYDNTKGQQFGSGSKPFSALTLTTSEIAGTITSVKVNTSGANSVNATFKVKVGDTYFTSGEADHIAVTNTATDYTFTGSASGAVALEWAQTSSKALYIKSIEVTYTPAGVAVAAPTFAPGAGLYYTAQNVAISCETADAIIHYTLDGTAPTAQSPIYSTPIAVNTTTTIKAIAVKGTDSSTVASATYTFPVEVANIAAFKAANTATNSTVYKITGDVTFVFKNGANIYVQDTTGGLLIYDQGTSVITRTYTEGDVISGGVYGSCTLYNGLVELIPTRDLAASTINTGAVAPIVATVADIKANYAQFESKLVTISDVTFAGGSFNTSSATNINVEQDGETMQVRNVYKTLSMTIPAGFKANVTGFVLRYNNNFQLAPRANEDVQFGAVTLPYMVDFDQNVDPGFVIANGNYTDKWYIGQAQGFDNNKLYISSNNGVTNKYDVNAYSDVLAYRDVIIPENGAVLNFDSRTMGENGDVLVVYIYNYSADEYYTIFWEYDEPEWNHINMPISPEYAGPGQLVFRWVNNGNGQGEQFPIAIDNISLTEAVCAQPIALTPTVTGETAVITWNTADSTQNSWTLEYKLEDHNEWYSMNTTVPTATLTALQGNSTYDLRVKANCGNESSEWTETQFNIGCINFVPNIFDTTVTVGTGTSTSSGVPFNTLYGYSFTEQIYPASEINVESVIKSISFYHKPNNTTAAQTNNIVVYMKNVERSTFSTTNYEAVSESDIVFSGSWTIPGTEGWATIVLDKPFKYDGHSNLMIAMHENTSGYSTRYFTYTDETAATISFYSDSSDPNPYSLGSYSGSKTVRNLRGNIQIAFYEDNSYCADQLACAAPDSLTITDITIDGATISWNGDAANYSFEYKTGEAEWTVVNVSTNTYTLTGLTQKTDYLVRVKAICGENNYSLYTEEVPFTTLSICPVVTNIETSNLSTTTTISWTPGSNENEWNLRFRPVGSNEWVNLHISGIASTTFGGLQDQTNYEVEIMALCDPTDEDNQSSWAHYEFTSGCAPFELPFEEGFASTTRPDCWESNGIIFNGTVAVADSAAEWLMTPPVQIPGDNKTYIVVDMQGTASLMASYRGTQMNRFTEIATLGNDETGHYIIEVPASLKDKAVNFMFLASENFSIDNVEFTQCAFVPVNLTAANPLNNAVELSWNGINNNGWVVEYAELGTDNWTSVNVEQTTDTVTYTLTGLEGSTDYKFRVRTICAGGFMSQPSNEAYVTTRCDAVSVPYEDFNGSIRTLNCWTPYFTGTSDRSYVTTTYAGKLQMYNYYNSTLDATDNTALGDLYAILPMMDTALSALQINFTAETYFSNDPDVVFQLGVVTDINRPAQTFRQLGSDYTAVYTAASYTYILNNVDYAGNLAFRVKKSTETKDLRLSNIKVELIPACQKPRNVEAIPLTENSMNLKWTKIGTQPRWEIKYMKVYSEYSDFDPDYAGTLATANSSPRTFNNLEYGAWYVFYMRTKCGEGEYSDGWVGPVKKQLLMEYNIANTTTVNSCHGKVVYQQDTAETNIMTIHASSPNSWVALTGNVNMGTTDTLYVYEGPVVDASKLLVPLFGTRTDLYITPLCESELTLQLKKAANSNPTLNLEISCEAVPTCSAPTDLAYNELTNTLTWEAGCWGTAESYTIQIENAQGVTVQSLTSTTTSVVIPIENLSNGTYYATVMPVCNGQLGDGKWISFDRVACADPTNFTANITGTTAQLTWSGNAALGYEVGYKLHGAYTWNTDNVTTTSYTITGLDDDVDYDFRVRAICNASDQSAYVTTTEHVGCMNSAVVSTTVSLGSGTSTNYYLPTYIYYNYSLTEQIYTASEIGMAGSINSVSFYYTGSTSRTVDVYLTHTDKNTFTGSYDWVPVTNADKVFSGSFSPTANAWNTITLDTPFQYNGRDNLLLVVDDNTGSYQSSVYAYVYSASNQTLRVYSDGTNYNPSSPSSYSGTRMSVKNQVQFGITGEVCDPTVSCPAPSNVELSNVDIDNAVVSWNRGGSETSWTVVYSLDGAAEVTVAATDTFITITGLEASSTYTLNISVYANCNQQSEGVSEMLNINTPPCSGGASIVFTGTSSSNYIPTYILYNYSYTQQIYLANEINAPNGGQIESLSFEVNNTSSATRNIDVYLMHTTSTSVSSGFLPLNNATLVYSGNTLLQGVVTLNFTTPFEYNGSDNLVLIVDDNTGSWVSSIPFKTHTGPSGCSRYVYNDDTNYNPSSVTGGTATTSRNNISFTVCPPPACPTPANFVFNSSNNTLTWTGSADSYTLQYREAGTEAFTTVTTTTESYSFTGLSANTTYEYQIQGDCGDDGFSRMSALQSFRTQCEAFDMPFVEDFEATSTSLACWTAMDLDGDGQGWFFVNTQDGNTLIASASYDDDNGVAYDADNWLISPAINITSGAVLTYTAGSVSASYLDHYSVYVTTSLSDLSSAVVLVNNQEAPASMTEYTFDLSAFAGQTINVIFRHNDYDEYWFLLDDVSVMIPPTCSTPNALVFANDTLSWEAGSMGTPAGYNVRYRIEGDEEWTTVTTANNTYEFINLQSSSTYQVQVQTNCGNEDLSEWSDMLEIHTPTTCFTPTELTVSDVTVTGATITWNDSYNQTNYAVEYKAEGETAWTTVAGDTTRTLTLTNLNDRTTYTVRMKTVCSEYDESEYTDEVEFTTYCWGYSIVSGEGTVEIKGTTSTNSGYFPTYNLYNYSYTQQIFKANEINTPDGCTINSVTFEVSSDYTTEDIRNIDLYLMATTEESISAYLPINNAVKVYSGEVYYGGQTVTVNFTTPFEYDGTSNLVLIGDDNTGSWSSTVYFRVHTGHANCSRYVYQDDTNYNPATVTGGNTSSYRNNVVFGVSTRVVNCPPDYDLAIESIEPIADACDLSDAKVVVKLRNNSYLNAVNGFTVSYAVNGAETPVTETVNATILPLETYVHTFAATPLFIDGSNDIVVNVVYENDEVEDNNTIALNDIRQVVPATVPYEQDFSNVVLGRDAWTQGAENNNPNLWINNNGVLTFVDSDTIDAQNYVITHCIEIPAGQMQVSYDYNALSNMPENMNVYMGTTPDIASMTLIGSHSNFTKDADGYTYNYLFNNENAGIYYFAIEATSVKGNMGVTFDNLAIMPMVDVTVIAGPNGTVTPNGTVKVPYRGDLTLNIIPNDMYHTAGVWVDSVRVMNEDPYNASFMMYTLENITESHTIEVRFKMEFHINKYAYNYSDQYAEVGGRFEPAEADTLLDPSGHVLTMIADEHYSLHSLVVGIIPPASEGAIIDGDNVIANVNYDEATRTYTYTFDTLYVSNYYVQACFKKDTVAINYATLTGIGVYDGVSVAAGETHNTWVDYGSDFTSTIQPADGYYNMGVTVNGVDKDIIDHYDFDSLITTQYVMAQFGHKVTASIQNFNNAEYLGSDEVRGTIAPAEQMILSGSSCSVAGTIQEHFHMSNFFVNGVDMLSAVTFDGYNFSYTIDSLVANTDIVAVVRIDTIAIYYTVDGGNGYVNGDLMEAPAMDTLYIEYGSDFMSQFAAATGYHIVNVTVNGTAYGEVPSWLTEFITAPQYVTATFALNEYDITTAAHGNGSVSDGVHVVYDPQSIYTFTATPAEGYHISQILRNNESLVIA